MSERPLESPYSPAAQAVLDAFCSWDHRPDRRREYETRGLICTNNLGLHMNAMVEGPGKLNYQLYFQSLPPTAQRLLSQGRESNPELWVSALDAYNETRRTGQLFAQQLASQDPAAHATGVEFERLGWERDTLLTEVFESFGQIEAEDALSLCR